MGQRTLDGADLTDLRERYHCLVHERLPAAAQAGEQWPIHDDHCFPRVVLNTLFEDEWSDHVEGRPAHEHLSPAALEATIDIAERMLAAGRPLIQEHNDDSLRWRHDP